MDVKSFWDRRATDPSLDDAQVTHPDVWQRWLEIELTRRWLRLEDRVLDIGCGAGYATRQFAPLVREIIGIDASVGMIERAREVSAERPQANLSFRQCDVLAADPATLGLFDVVLSMRCLINLPDWDSQKLALARIAGLLRPGGRFVFVEGSSEGRGALNALRQSVGLPAMPPVWHNRDFEERSLLDELVREFVVLEHRPLGVYDLVARVVHPLLVAPAPPRYEAPINEIAAKLALALPGLPEIGRVLFLALERREQAGESDRDRRPPLAERATGRVQDLQHR
jgi:SAM-dependent methyltransferase